MAGIGINLNKIFKRNTIITNLVGYTYSTMSTIAPMILVIGSIIIMNIVLDTEIIEYSHRELFACTILYIFIFSLLTTSPLNAVLSRYMSDIIYKERYEDILPCFYAGLIINIVCKCHDDFLLKIEFWFPIKITAFLIRL